MSPTKYVLMVTLVKWEKVEHTPEAAHGSDVA